MGDIVGAKIEGADELLRTLTDLGGNAEKAIKGAVRKGSKVIADAAIVLARAISKTPGRPVSIRVRKVNGYAVSSIFPAKGHKELTVLEYGTSAGWRVARAGRMFKFYAGKKLIKTRAIHHPGTPAKPWLRPAFDQQSDAAVDALGQALADAVEKQRVIAEGEDDE